MNNLNPTDALGGATTLIGSSGRLWSTSFQSRYLFSTIVVAVLPAAVLASPSSGTVAARARYRAFAVIPEKSLLVDATATAL